MGFAPKRYHFKVFLKTEFIWQLYPQESLLATFYIKPIKKTIPLHPQILFLYGDKQLFESLINKSTQY